ncbi:hypothetical protein ES703_58885 [subsurface metagenome]
MNDLDSLEFAARADEFGGVGEKHEPDALLFCGLDLVGDGRHLALGAAVENGNISTQTKCRAGGINGRVAAANHGHPLTDLRCFALIYACEKINCSTYPVQILTRDAHLTFLVSSDSKEHRVVVLD